MSGITKLIEVMSSSGPSQGGGTGLMIGTILQGTPQPVKLLANGLEIEREDLWIADGVADSLETGNAVLVYSPDAQLYYIIAKVVPA